MAEPHLPAAHGHSGLLLSEYSCTAIHKSPTVFKPYFKMKFVCIHSWKIYAIKLHEFRNFCAPSISFSFYFCMNLLKYLHVKVLTNYYLISVNVGK